MSQYSVKLSHACGLFSLNRSSYYYQSVDSLDDNMLRKRIKEIALIRRRFGYRRIHTILVREGFKVNHKKVYRIYKEENLTVKKRKRKKTAKYLGEKALAPIRPNERWSMDFVHDSLACGRKIRTLNIVDDFTRECLAIEVDHSIGGKRVIKVLERLKAERGLPESILTDNGSEFTGNDMGRWAYARNQRHLFIEPGKPFQNCFVESFNGRFRDECLNEHWFLNLQHAKEVIEEWRLDYNNERPHGSLNEMTPAEYAREWSFSSPHEKRKGTCSAKEHQSILSEN